METFFLGMASAVIGGVIGAGIKTWFDRFQATWNSRRSVAADAFGAAVAVHSSVVSALRFARQVFATATDNQHHIQGIAESSEGRLGRLIDVSKARLDALRDVRLNTQAIWGPHVAALFDEYHELTTSWHNALATFYDDIHGHVDYDEWSWDTDVTGFDWQGVLGGIAPHAELFEREEEQLMELIRQFARCVGVAITDVHQLPDGVREVVAGHVEHRARRELAVARQAALPPPTGGPR